MCGLLCGLLELQISRARRRHETAAGERAPSSKHQLRFLPLEFLYSARAIKRPDAFSFCSFCVSPLASFFNRALAPRLLHEIVRCQKIAL